MCSIFVASFRVCEDAQNVYEEKRMEKRKKWEEEVKAYMELPKWKDRRLRFVQPVCSDSRLRP